MKIVITGGAGFVGTNLCLSLKTKHPHYKIVAFDNLRRSGSEINLPDLKKYGVEFIHGDIRNRYDFDLLGKYDLMIDASAEPSAMAGIQGGAAALIEHNLTGTIHCITDCIQKGAKLIFLSTSRVYPYKALNSIDTIELETRYDFNPSSLPKGCSSAGISEEFTINGARTFYGATKLCAEQLIQEFKEFNGLNASIIRFGLIAGPRQMGKSEQGLLSFWMAAHYFGKNIKYIGFEGSGKQVRDVLHIRDVETLVDDIIHNSNYQNIEMLNAGGGRKNSISLLELTEMCKSISGKEIIITKDTNTRPGDVKIYITDSHKISSISNWKPEFMVEDTLRDIHSWITGNNTILQRVLT